MVRRTLMLRDQELADFDVNPSTGEARIVDMASDDLATSLGLTGKNRDQVLATLILRRTLSPLRKDMNDVLATFRATSPVDLALMGHGLSLSDQFWYRAPGASEHWKDVNFFDNDWDPDFGASVLLGDYTRLAACSPDVPEATTPGHAVKAWERNDGGIFLVKTAEYPDGSELVGAKLGSELCSLLLGEGHYVPLDVVERYGRPCSISPLMLHGDEELANGNRLCAMANMWENPSLMSKGGITAEACDALIDAYAAIGIADASAGISRRQIGCQFEIRAALAVHCIGCSSCPLLSRSFSLAYLGFQPGQLRCHPQGRFGSVAPGTHLRLRRRFRLPVQWRCD